MILPITQNMTPHFILIAPVGYLEAAGGGRCSPSYLIYLIFILKWTFCDEYGCCGP